MAARLEADDASLVSTDTTPSEGKEAATRARSFAASARRYEGLTDLSEARVEGMLPARPVIGKQVEPSWCVRISC